jgi:CBS domain containing-hemolysin-like protein
MPIVLGWLAVAALIAGNGLFVAAEFGLTAVDRARVARLAESGDRRARAVLRAVRELSFQLSGAQLGITVCSLLLGFVAEPVVAAALQAGFAGVGLSGAAVEPVAVVLALLLATVAQMLFGELVPQNLAISRPLPTARAVIPLQTGFARVCRPVIALFNNTANAIVRGLGATLYRARTGLRWLTWGFAASHAVRWYSLMTPPRIRRRLIGASIGITTAGSWLGGRWSRL